MEDGACEDEVGTRAGAFPLGLRGWRGGVGAQVGEGEGGGFGPVGERDAARFCEHGGGGVDAGDGCVGEAGGEELGAVSGPAAEVDDAGG